MTDGPDQIDTERAFFLATAREHLAESFRENSPAGQASEILQAVHDMDSANTPEHLVNYYQNRVDDAAAQGKEPNKLDLQDLWNARIVLGAKEAGYTVRQDFDLW